MPGLNHIAWFVTDFADQAVLLPLALVTGILLYAFGWRRGALVWTAIVVGTFALMLLLKVGFGACGDYVTGGRIESPSGHTAAAGVIYGSIFAFLVEKFFGRTPLTVVAILLVVAIVGYSRVLLGAHTVGEVIVGAVVGIVAAWLMVRGVGDPDPRSPVAFLLLPLCAVLFVFHGLHFPAERAIRSWTKIMVPIPACQEVGAAATRGLGAPLAQQAGRIEYASTGLPRSLQLR